MTDLHALARAQFEDRRGELVRLPIPELADDAAIWCYRYPDGAEFAEMLDYVDFDAVTKRDFRMLATVFRLAARSESGQRIFNSVNSDQINTQWDPAIVVRLVDEIGWLDTVYGGAADEAKKN